ncbi:MAG: SDR family oxidoreductase [Candidatus Zipacnadales bacterium]
MGEPDFDVVTGAFGYSGKHITRRLLVKGRLVKTLTGHPDRPNPFGDQVEVAPFNFQDPEALTQTLRGAKTLYNTYWIRFARGKMTFDLAVKNSRTLIKCAEAAGVERFVHTSIVRPSPDSPYPYYRGKAAVEEILTCSSLSYAILRPTLFFGGEDVLVNNIAWTLRHFPFFPLVGEGDYRIQPIHVDDFADLATQAGQGEEKEILDVAGPEIYTFREFVETVAKSIGVSVRLIRVPKFAMGIGARMIGLLVRDVLLTKDELNGLIDGLMVSDQKPRGTTKLSDWLAQNRSFVGTIYARELPRHFR